MGEGQAFTRGISEIHAGASIILRGVGQANQGKSENPQEKYARLAKEGKRQEVILEDWAKAADLWLNDYTDPDGNKANTLDDLLRSQWEYMDQGSEAEVYRFDQDTVLKSLNLSHSNDNPQQLLDKIALFNQLFPETSLSVVVFGRDYVGHFRVLITQRLIRGSEGLSGFKNVFTSNNMVKQEKCYIKLLVESENVSENEGQ